MSPRLVRVVLWTIVVLWAVSIILRWVSPEIAARTPADLNTAFTAVLAMVLGAAAAKGAIKSDDDDDDDAAPPPRNPPAPEPTPPPAPATRNREDETDDR